MNQPLKDVKRSLAKSLKSLAGEIQENTLLIKTLQEDVDRKCKEFAQMMQGFLSMMPQSEGDASKDYKGDPKGPQDHMSQELAASQAKIQEMLKAQQEAFMRQKKAQSSSMKTCASAPTPQDQHSKTPGKSGA